MEKSLFVPWLKGIGAFLILFIFWHRIQGIGDEKQERLVFILLTLSMIVLPIILGKLLDYFALSLLRLSRSWKSEENPRQLEAIFAWIPSIILNLLAMKSIFSRNTFASFRIYIENAFLRKLILAKILGLNIVGLLILATIITLFSLFLYAKISPVKKIISSVIYPIALIVSLVSITVLSWQLTYLNTSNYHLNALLFPLAAIVGNSPYQPLVSDDFISLYGGYYLWLHWLTDFTGNTLLSLQLVLCSVIFLQIVLYFAVTKVLFKNSLFGVLVFFLGIFWSYFYSKMITQDLYFQYFPLRTFFPCLLIVVVWICNRKNILRKKLFVGSSIEIGFCDILLDAITAIALLNNIDSGLSALMMRFSLYLWNRRKRGIFRLNLWGEMLLNLAIVLVVFLLIFRISTGYFPNPYLYLDSTIKFASGTASLPIPDNLWMFLMLVYAFNIVQPLFSKTDDDRHQYQLLIALWGIVSMPYFINRSHPWNLLAISLPFFLGYGLLIQWSFRELEKINPFSPDYRNRSAILPSFPARVSALLPLSFYATFILPFALIVLMALGQLPVAIARYVESPKSTTQIQEVQLLSREVSQLEKTWNRPSIFLSYSFDAYLYFIGRRPVLFYPEGTSIFEGDDFQPRFIKALDKYNPLVIYCPISQNHKRLVASIGLDYVFAQFLELLDKNNYKIIESQHLKSIGRCDIYARSEGN